MSFTQRYRARLVINSLKQFLSDKNNVLDIGCGNGVVSYEIKKYFNCSLTGTDVTNYLKTDIDFKIMKNNKLDFDEQFDYGLIIDVLHHMSFEEQALLIKESLRVCRSLLIVECEPPGLLGRFIDYLFNKFYDAGMPITYTYRKLNGWLDIFNGLNLYYRCYNTSQPFFHPYTYRLYEVKNA